VCADGTEPALKKRNPLLGLRFRYAVTDPERTRRLTDPFTHLFRPVVLVTVLAAFAVVCWWVFFHKGLASAAYDAFERPGLLILVFAVTVLSAGFHEFGHAAAARYGGATPGVMGFGLYLVWPAFYTDVTDSYRLGRRGRLRTDLGGLYFNAVVAVAITALWLALRYDALLLVVATQIIQMIRQLTPLVRFDGYHVLADLTGVPDLYGRMKPTLIGMLPWKWNHPEARVLKPWARIVVTLWVLVVVPVLVASLAAAVYALPRLMGTAWASLNKQQDVLAHAWVDGDMTQSVARVLAMVAIVIPMAGIVYVLVRFTRRAVAGTWHATEGKPVMRLVAALFGAAILAGVLSAWLDSNNYRPIQANERGTIGDIVYALQVENKGEPRTVSQESRPAAASKLVEGQRGVMRAMWDTATPMPSQRAPELAVILVPRMPTTSGGGGGAALAAPAIPADQGWVFPFDKPLAPEPGDTQDNQALAVNTTDNTVVYDTAFALVWQTDEEHAMNVNEAHAYASCDSCAAVAVAYQVVFVIDQDATNDNVAVPQNLAGALNYECVNCLTYALAQQLFVTLDRPLSDGARAELDALWAQIAAFQRDIEAGKVPTSEIRGRLEAYNNQVKAIVEADQPGTFPTQTAAPSTPTNSPTVVPEASAPSSATPTPSATVAPAPSNTAEPITPEEPTAAGDLTSVDATDVESTSEPTTNADPTATSAPTADETSSNETTADSTASDTSSSDGSTSDSSNSSP
jgi:putative peptide zinc metalloprotease protein